MKQLLAAAAAAFLTSACAMAAQPTAASCRELFTKPVETVDASAAREREIRSSYAACSAASVPDDVRALAHLHYGRLLLASDAQAALRIFRTGLDEVERSPKSSASAAIPLIDAIATAFEQLHDETNALANRQRSLMLRRAVYVTNRSKPRKGCCISR